MALSKDDADLVGRIARARAPIGNRLRANMRPDHDPIALSSAEAQTLWVLLEDLERRLRKVEP